MRQIHTKEKTAIVEAACREFKDLPTLTLAKVLYKQHRRLWPNLDACRNSIRTRRGNNGNRVRPQAPPDLLRPNQPAGFTWTFPKSSAPDYAPFILDAERTLILSDLHIPFHDTPAINAVIERARGLNPDCILLNGDVCDFFSISRFDKNPAESSLKKELQLTRQFLGWLRQEFPAARVIYKLGNHDEWFDKYLLRKAPAAESAPATERGRPGTSDFARRVMWWSLLVNTPAGVSYSARDVAEWTTRRTRDDTGQPWRQGMELPGARAMAPLADFLNVVGFWRLKPFPQALGFQPGASSQRNPMVASRTAAGDLVSVYVPEQRSVAVMPGGWSAAAEASWFDPRTGESRPAAPAVVRPPSWEFATPAAGDWVLVVKDRK